MTDRYCKAILDIIKEAVQSTIDSATDSATAEGLLQTMLYPALEARQAQFDAKVLEVLEPHRRGHAITYNHYFTDTVQKARNEHQKKEQAQRLRDFFGIGPTEESSNIGQSFRIAELVGSLAVSTQEDMDRYACSEATYCMKAYYKARNTSDDQRVHSQTTNAPFQVAMKVLVDNFSVLAVEKCLLHDLADILSPDTIIKLSDDEVAALAAETETSLRERQRAMEEVATLQEGLTVLSRFGQFRGAGKLTQFSYTFWQGRCRIPSHWRH